MLYIVNEMTFSGYNAYNLDLLYIIAILLGILVIISKNPVVSVLFLIGLFLCISAYLILTGLNFIGLSYLLVYIGAVVVRMNKFAALVRIQLYKVLLAWWYNARSPFLSYKKNKYRDFSSLTLKKTLLKQKPKPILGARSYSTITPGNSLNNTEFYEWLCGFVDGEGSFRIKKDSRRDKSPYSWEFTILLHIDDKHVLDYIQKRLNIGHVKNYDRLSRFSVYSKTELKEIINIFSKYPLNTSASSLISYQVWRDEGSGARLNFEDWKKAFELYNKDNVINDNREKIIPVVEKLREGMNKGRYYAVSYTHLTLPTNREV